MDPKRPAVCFLASGSPSENTARCPLGEEAGKVDGDECEAHDAVQALPIGDRPSSGQSQCRLIQRTANPLPIILVHVPHNAHNRAKVSPVRLSTVSSGQIAVMEPTQLAEGLSTLVLITVRCALTFSCPRQPCSSSSVHSERRNVMLGPTSASRLPQRHSTEIMPS